jgi:peptidoglycan/LPS O-acetylase OafA/YrhL
VRGKTGDLPAAVTDVYEKPRHRDDLQGLRAIAVLLVAFDHAGVGFLRGGYVGVDVFFVLSGFLITQLLLAEAARSDRVSLVNFYIRRARRILPAAALTLVATDVAAYLLLNSFRALQTMKDSVWAALFAANVNYGRQATDYFAQGQPASPLLHFWSLSVEEQFYFFWPTVLAIVLLGVFAGVRLRRGGGRFTGAAVGGLMVVALLGAAASFAYAHHLLQVDPAGAYFSSIARAWELALGAVLAIGIRWVTRVPAAMRLAAGWAGLGCIGVAAVAYSSSTPFPGKAALLPTLGAALVIASGVRAGEEHRQAGRLLGWLPLRYVGDRSYTFYLWHWPFLAIAFDYEGHALPLATNLLLLALAFGLSIVTYRYYENPIRRMRWKPPAGVLLWPVSAGVVLVVAFVGIRSIESSAAGAQTAQAAVQPAMVVGTAHGPAALPAVIASVKAALRGAPIPSALVPSLFDLPTDRFGTPSGCASANGAGETSAAICYIAGPTAAPRSTPTPGRKTLVVLGDSHAEMWIRPLLAMAGKDHWDVVPMWKSGCTPAILFAGYTANGNLAECHAWYQWALAKIAGLHPDTVLISFLDAYSGSVATKNATGIAGLLATENSVAKHVVLMLDSPYLASLPLPVDCLQASGATLQRCTGAWGGGPSDSSHTLRTLARLHHVGVMDPVGWFCYKRLCPLVLGHTVAFADYGHVTRTYATALAPPFRAAFRAALKTSSSGN